MGTKLCHAIFTDHQAHIILSTPSDQPTRSHLDIQQSQCAVTSKSFVASAGRLPHSIGGRCVAFACCCLSPLVVCFTIGAFQSPRSVGPWGLSSTQFDDGTEPSSRSSVRSDPCCSPPLPCDPVGSPCELPRLPLKLKLFTMRNMET